MKNEILERIKQVIREKGTTQRKLAEGVKISLTTINKLLNSEDDLSVYTIRKFVEFLELNEQWVLIGTGPKYKGEAENGSANGHALQTTEAKLTTVQELQLRVQSVEEENRRLKHALANSSYKINTEMESKVLFVDSKTSVTYHETYSDPDFLNSLPFFTLPISRFTKNEYRAFEIIGDAMSSKISSGDWAICEKIEDLSQLRDYYTCVVVLDYETQCRRVINRLKERDRLRLKPDNVNFGDIEVTRDQIKEVWMVKSIMTFNLKNPNYNVEEWLKRLEDMMYGVKDEVQDVKSEVKDIRDEVRRR